MATKKAINQAISQANTVAGSKFYSHLNWFINGHWKGVKSKADSYKKFMSANQRILKTDYKHDVLGYVGDEQLGRWCPRDCNYMLVAPFKIASGSLSPLPFTYDKLAHTYRVYSTQLNRYQAVGNWAKAWKVNGGDVFSIVYVILQRQKNAHYPDYYNWHSTDKWGVITLRVSDNIRKDKRDISNLMFSDVFRCDDAAYASNFRFPITKPFGLLQVVNDPEWVYWRVGFGMECVGAWAIVHSRRTMKDHASTTLNLENQHLFGLDYTNMLNDYL